MKALLFLSIFLSSCFASMPNIKFPTLGGMQFWDDVQEGDGFKIQQHLWTKHYRLLDEDNWRLAWGSLKDCQLLLPNNDVQDQPLIILLHGLGRSHYSMMPLKNSLSEAGYKVTAYSYSSMLSKREVFARNLASFIDRSSHSKVFLVTHSLGGIVLRDYVKNHDSSKVIAAVTLAAPHQGSVIVDNLAKVNLHYLLGPTGMTLSSELMQGQSFQFKFPVFTVAGEAQSFPFLPLGFLLGKNSDGIVKAVNARLEGAKHYSVNASHTFIMNDREVFDLIDEKVKALTNNQN